MHRLKSKDIFNFAQSVLNISAFVTFFMSLNTAYSMTVTRQDTDLSTTQAFNQFALLYNKPYRTNKTEFARRFSIFQENIERIKLLNEPYGNLTAPVYGFNKFSDLTPQEFEETYLSDWKPERSLKFSSEANVDSGRHTQIDLSSLPKSVDWRNKHVLTEVRNQKTCGACWAFSVVETIESMYAIEYNRTVPSLSVQQLIDCDTSNFGCVGGDIADACNFTKKTGVVPSSAYPLKDKKESCRSVSPRVPRVDVDSCLSKSYTKNETAILDLLANQGPVSIAVDARTWHNYVGGVIRFHCPSHINHAAQLVGYNTEGDVPYYIVRNSWGTNFGEGGYLRIKIGGNLCGISSEVVSLHTRKQELN